MGRKPPHRQEITDRDFPVRITVRADPATYDLIRQWLQRPIGAHDDASNSGIMWPAQRGQGVYFCSVQAVLMFPAGCLHIQLHWEK